MPVTLINVLSVPKSKADECARWWREVKDTRSRRLRILMHRNQEDL